MLTPSSVPLNTNRLFMPRFLAVGVPSLYHSLKFSLSRIALALFQEITFAFSYGSLDIIVVEVKEMEGDPLTPL